MSLHCLTRAHPKIPHGNTTGKTSPLSPRSPLCALFISGSSTSPETRGALFEYTQHPLLLLEIPHTHSVHTDASEPCLSFLSSFCRSSSSSSEGRDGRRKPIFAYPSLQQQLLYHNSSKRSNTQRERERERERERASKQPYNSVA